MALLQPTAAIYHHPLESATESLEGEAWSGTGLFSSAKVGSGLAPDGNDAARTGTSVNYTTTVGSTKIAYIGWFKRPSGPTLKGYVTGGDGQGVGTVSTIDSLTFSSDTTATVTSTLTASRWGGFAAGFAGSAAGYSTGGNNDPGDAVSTIDKLTFSDESVAAIVSGLTGTRQYGAAGFESSTAGYACGGSSDPGGTVVFNVADKLTFADDSVAATVSTLTTSRWQGVGGFAGSTAGYICGGRNSGGTFLNTVDKLTFSTDGVAANTSNLTVTRAVGAAAFESSAAGYACGGNEDLVDTPLATIDKLTFSTDNIAANTSSLATAKWLGNGGFASGSGGYIAGGLTAGAATSSNTIEKLTFSNDNSAAIVSALSGTRSFGVSSFENDH